jgi:hypothetical protein
VLAEECVILEPEELTFRESKGHPNASLKFYNPAYLTFLTLLQVAAYRLGDGVWVPSSPLNKSETPMQLEIGQRGHHAVRDFG